MKPMVMANAQNEFLRDLISLSYKLDQLIDQTRHAERTKLLAMRDQCDDTIARLLGLDESTPPVAATSTVADFHVNLSGEQD